MLVDQAKQFDSVAISRQIGWSFASSPVYDFSKIFASGRSKLPGFEQTLAEVTGQRIRVEFALTADEPGEPPSAARAAPFRRTNGLAETMHPLVQRAAELFGAPGRSVDDPPPKE